MPRQDKTFLHFSSCAVSVDGMVTFVDDQYQIVCIYMYIRSG